MKYLTFSYAKKFSAFVPWAICSPRWLMAPNLWGLVYICMLAAEWCACFKAPDFCIKFIASGGGKLSKKAVGFMGRASVVMMYLFCAIIWMRLDYFSARIFMTPLVAAVWNTAALIIIGACLRFSKALG
jgi:hypothetical protein